MNIQINELINKQIIEINSTYSFKEIEHKSIKKLDDINIKGYVKYNLMEEIEINLEVNGKMYLEDSITLEDIPYSFNFKIEELIDENNKEQQKYFKNNQNTLDIIEILWENIVLEVPISYTKNKGVNLKGNGWELNGISQTEDEDSVFAKLNDIFKGGE